MSEGRTSLEIRRLAGIARPDVGIITNVTAAHLERLHTVDAVASAKGELFEAMGHPTIQTNPAIEEGYVHSLSHGVGLRVHEKPFSGAGVTDLVSFSACGSYREELPPGTFVLVDNFVDRTYRRESSFFGAGCVVHVPFSHPVGPVLQGRLARAAQEEGIPFRLGGTAVCMEGPQFSTLAESLIYRQQDYDVVHMTSMPEAKLAREAEITYAVVAMVTDFDCWHPTHDSVGVEGVLKVMAENRDKAQRLFARLVRDFPAERAPCPVGSERALDGAILTAPEARDPALLAKLDAVAGRVLRSQG